MSASANAFISMRWRRASCPILCSTSRTAIIARQDSTRQKDIIETICVKYPDDMEARAWLALNTMGDSRYGAELIIREILGQAAGSSRRPIITGFTTGIITSRSMALDSAKRYGEIVYGIGHALHMPGHIFSIVGMWNEAAISMDAATRARKNTCRIA